MKKVRTKQLWMICVATCLLLGGLSYLLVPRINAAFVRHDGRRQNTTRLDQAVHEVSADTQTAMTLGRPVAMTLDRLGISLQIVPGTYRSADQSWALDMQHAFLMQSPDEAPLSTPIIYGHNIPAVFRKLDGVAANEVLKMQTEDGRELLFRYVADSVVLPNDDTVFRSQLHNTVLIMTCTGSHFQHRRILQFEYLGSQQLSAVGREGASDEFIS